MNEFLEQFVIEARDLAEQAADDLLALERDPGDRDRLDSAFRGFHTLKGAAAIVEFAAMGRAVHAAEDVLDAVRRGARPAGTDVIDASLACLEAVRRWLDQIETAGDLPADADAAADALVAGFTTPATPAAPPLPAGDQGWIDALRTRAPDATVALRLTPDADCFFRAEDPLALVAALPGLAAVGLAPRRPWPAAGDIDPFACNLVVTALCRSTVTAVADHLGPMRRQAEILALAQDPADGLPAPAAALLQAQIALARIEGDGLAGRLGAAGRVAANILRRLGRPTAAIETALAIGLDAGDPQPFVAAVEAALAGDSLAGDPLAGDARKAAPSVAPGTTAAARALRVDVERIDALVRLTGELTVVKNAIGHAAGMARDGGDAGPLADLLHRQHAMLDSLTAELQRAVLTIRVLPLRHVFQRFPLMVRDMAAALGKTVQLKIEGEDTEADKTVVEALFEPLLHVLRNALDHGIEDAGTRAARGKSPAAQVVLSARRDGDQVIVAVTDDGAGIDPAAIRRVAAARGLAAAAALDALPDDEVIDLVFAPGFSTATAVTDLSGRGVGMDAVRTAIGRIGGRVAVASRPGAGTTVRFALPFSVMVTRVMTVEAGGQVFGIPFDAVVETTQCAREDIASVGQAAAFVLRDRTIPLIVLAEALGREAAIPQRPLASIVVTEAAGMVGALEVDRIGAPLDVMLKPLEGLLAGMRGIAGTTLTGDGRVLIVLDVQGLLQ